MRLRGKAKGELSDLERPVVDERRPARNRLLRPSAGSDFAPRLATIGGGGGNQERGRAVRDGAAAIPCTDNYQTVGPIAYRLLIGPGLPSLAVPCEGPPEGRLQMEPGSMVLVSLFLRKKSQSGLCKSRT
jgi:hypothetical protein